MDPQTDLPDLIEDLEVNIDELTSTLTPLLPPHSLSKTSSSLPLLDKSKLHVLAAYAIESILFSTLQASGTDAKAHAIYPELARLKGYFAKIQDAEDHVRNAAEKEGRARLDVGAAQRFIRHGLAGNERWDEMRRERVGREKALALEKARALTNKTFESEEEGTPRKRGVAAISEEEGATPAKKHKGGAGMGDGEKEDALDQVPHKSAEREAMDLDAPAPAKKKRGRPSKKDKAAAEATPQKHTDTPTRATRSSALASGSPASATKTKKGKARGKGK